MCLQIRINNYRKVQGISRVETFFGWIKRVFPCEISSVLLVNYKKHEVILFTSIRHDNSCECFRGNFDLINVHTIFWRLRRKHYVLWIQQQQVKLTGCKFVLVWYNLNTFQSFSTIHLKLGYQHCQWMWCKRKICHNHSRMERRNLYTMGWHDYF